MKDQERPNNSRERRAQADTGRKYLLSGFLRCGHKGENEALCGCKKGGQPPRGTNHHPAYRCVAARCRKVGRRADLVDEYVVGIALRALEEAYGDTARDESPFPGEKQLASLKAGGSVTSLTAGQICDLEEDSREFYAQQEDRNLLAGFAPERWATFDVRQKRLALAAVVDEVVIRPIPKDRTRNAPFDPGLIDVILKKRA